MLVLSERDMRACFSMADAIDAAEEAFRAVSNHLAVVPLRTVADLPDGSGQLISMPGYVPAQVGASAGATQDQDEVVENPNAGTKASLGVKVLGFFEGNRAKGLPTIPATMLVMDPTTGVASALLNGTYLTQLRTAAASGIATKLLAREDARVGALIGAGGQAPCQLEALLAARKLDEVRVSDARPGAAAALVDVLREPLGEAYGARLVACDSAQECVEDADVVTAVTTATDPVLDVSWLKPGVHVNGVGSYTPEMHELPGDLFAKASVCALDSRDAVLSEDGEIIDALVQGLLSQEDLCEIGEISLGRAKGRVSESDITVFKTVGVAAEDLVTAARIVAAAQAKGIGVEVEM